MITNIMEYINNQIIKKYIKKNNSLKGGNRPLEKIENINAYLNMLGDDGSEKFGNFKDTINNETKSLNELIDKYSVYKKLDEVELRKVIDNFNSEISDISKNKSNYEGKVFTKKKIGFDLSFYQNKLIEYVNSKINTDSSNIKFEVKNSTYEDLTSNIQLSIEKIKLLKNKLDTDIEILDKLSQRKVTHSLDPNMINTTEFINSLKIIESVKQDQKIAKETKHVESNIDFDSEIKTTLTQDILRNFDIAAAILKPKLLSDEIYKIISPVEIFDKYVYLPDDKYSNLKRKIVELKVITEKILHINNDLIQLENEKNKLDDSINKQKTEINFYHIDNNYVSKSDLEMIRSKKIFPLEFLKKKLHNEKKKNKNNMINTLLGKLYSKIPDEIQLPSSLYSILKDMINLIIDDTYPYNTIEKTIKEYLSGYITGQIEIINEYNKQVEDLKTKQSELKELQSTIEKNKATLIEEENNKKKIDNEINEQIKDIKWIQKGGGSSLVLDNLVKKLLDQNNLVHEVNMKYLTIKKLLNDIFEVNEKINETNKKINFIKLIILLSIKHQQKNNIRIYNILTKEILVDIQKKINEITTYRSSNDNKLSKFLDNYFDLLKLLDDIITNILNLKEGLLLNETNGIDLKVTGNPSKRYFNFINLTFNLIQKLYILVDDTKN